MTIIDGTELVLGRMASMVSKRLLKGEDISILNAEKIVLTGNKDALMVKYRHRFSDEP